MLTFMDEFTEKNDYWALKFSEEEFFFRDYFERFIPMFKPGTKVFTHIYVQHDEFYVYIWVLLEPKIENLLPYYDDWETCRIHL